MSEVVNQSSTQSGCLPSKRKSTAVDSLVPTPVLPEPLYLLHPESQTSPKKLRSRVFYTDFHTWFQLIKVSYSFKFSTECLKPLCIMLPKVHYLKPRKRRSPAQGLNRASSPAQARPRAPPSAPPFGARWRESARPLLSLRGLRPRTSPWARTPMPPARPRATRLPRDPHGWRRRLGRR